MELFNSLPGWRARKQPGSGIYSDFPHDVFAEHDTAGAFVVECKHWKHGWRTGDSAIGKADMLVIKRDFGAPMLYMSMEKFASLPWHLWATEPKASDDTEVCEIIEKSEKSVRSALERGSKILPLSGNHGRYSFLAVRKKRHD